MIQNRPVKIPIIPDSKKDALPKWKRILFKSMFRINF